MHRLAGLTGTNKNGTYETAGEIDKALAAGDNIGLVVAANVIVINVDDHTETDSPKVDRFLSQHSLPPTLFVTSRVDADGQPTRSGHHYYQSPDGHNPATKLEGRLPHGAGDTIHHNLRYAVLPGSIVEERLYRAWWHGQPVTADTVITVDDLPVIPHRLYAALLVKQTAPRTPGRPAKTPPRGGG